MKGRFLTSDFKVQHKFKHAIAPRLIYEYYFLSIKTATKPARRHKQTEIKIAMMIH
jgi:hypothetical protein